MHGYIDLHCHPLPSIDDGVRNAADGAALLAGLKRIGFDRVVATPHIRSGVWDNRRATIAPARIALDEALARLRDDGIALPELEIAAEHLFDDVALDLFAKGEAIPYSGGRTALIEFSYDNIPHRAELHLWRLKKSGITPVLAHPERCAPLYKSSDRLEELRGAGVRPLLDVMSLVGAYGRQSMLAAERMLSEGHYAAACSDAHKPGDVETVAEALTLLQRIVGDDEFRRLLIIGPAQLIQGRDT